MRILVTRPEPDAGLEVEALAARGHEAVLSPLLVIEQAKDVALDLDGAQALIVTSRNALRALSHHPALDAARTLAALRRGRGNGARGARAWLCQGHRRTGERGRARRADRRQAEPSAGRLVHLAGETLAFDLKSALEARGFSVSQPVLYRAVPATELAPEALTLHQGRQARRRHPFVAAHGQDLPRPARTIRRGNARQASRLLLHLRGGSRGVDPARISRARGGPQARGRCPCAPRL